MEKDVITLEGKLKLEQELDELVNVKRVENVRILQEARAQGDLSENADYDAAKEKQAEINARIEEIQYKLKHSILIDETKNVKGVVSIGSTVKVLTLNDQDELEFKIVGAVEADPFNGSISNDSPIATAILGKKIGDIVTVHVEKPYDLKILEVKN
ncbi:MAG: transcription elongation factor GreA [Bacilli bacterium]|nr:transcription elongation factor GreA [Bacilli bacterium]